MLISRLTLGAENRQDYVGPNIPLTFDFCTSASIPTTWFEAKNAPLLEDSLFLCTPFTAPLTDVSIWADAMHVMSLVPSIAAE